MGDELSPYDQLLRLKRRQAGLPEGGVPTDEEPDVRMPEIEPPPLGGLELQPTVAPMVGPIPASHPTALSSGLPDLKHALKGGPVVYRPIDWGVITSPNPPAGLEPDLTPEERVERWQQIRRDTAERQRNDFEALGAVGSSQAQLLLRRVFREYAPEQRRHFWTHTIQLLQSMGYVNDEEDYRKAYDAVKRMMWLEYDRSPELFEDGKGGQIKPMDYDPNLVVKQAVGAVVMAARAQTDVFTFGHLHEIEDIWQDEEAQVATLKIENEIRRTGGVMVQAGEAAGSVMGLTASFVLGGEMLQQGRALLGETKLIQWAKNGRLFEWLVNGAKYGKTGMASFRYIAPLALRNSAFVKMAGSLAQDAMRNGSLFALYGFLADPRTAVVGADGTVSYVDRDGNPTTYLNFKQRTKNALDDFLFGAAATPVMNAGGVLTNRLAHRLERMLPRAPELARRFGAGVGGGVEFIGLGMIPIHGDTWLTHLMAGRLDEAGANAIAQAFAGAMVKGVTYPSRKAEILAKRRYRTAMLEEVKRFNEDRRQAVKTEAGHAKQSELEKGNVTQDEVVSPGRREAAEKAADQAIKRLRKKKGESEEEFAERKALTGAEAARKALDEKAPERVKDEDGRERVEGGYDEKALEKGNVEEGARELVQASRDRGYEVASSGVDKDGKPYVVIFRPGTDAAKSSETIRGEVPKHWATTKKSPVEPAEPAAEEPAPTEPVPVKKKGMGKRRPRKWLVLRGEKRQVGTETFETGELKNQEKIRAGTPVRGTLWRGSGREEPQSVYAAGADGPALGEGRYSTPIKAMAEKFGPNTEQVTVEVRRPAVVRSDADLVAWAKRGGWPGEAVPYENAARVPMLKAARKAMEDAGHDGAVIYTPYTGDFDPATQQSYKRTQEIFGGTQVIEFKAPAEIQPATEKPKPKKKGIGKKRAKKPPAEKPKAEAKPETADGVVKLALMKEGVDPTKPPKTHKEATRQASVGLRALGWKQSSAASKNVILTNPEGTLKVRFRATRVDTAARSTGKGKWGPWKNQHRTPKEQLAQLLSSKAAAKTPAKPSEKPPPPPPDVDQAREVKLRAQSLARNIGARGVRPKSSKHKGPLATELAALVEARLAGRSDDAKFREVLERWAKTRIRKGHERAAIEHVEEQVRRNVREHEIQTEASTLSDADLIGRFHEAAGKPPKEQYTDWQDQLHEAKTWYDQAVRRDRVNLEQLQPPVDPDAVHVTGGGSWQNIAEFRVRKAGKGWVLEQRDRTGHELHWKGMARSSDVHGTRRGADKPTRFKSRAEAREQLAEWFAERATSEAELLKGEWPDAKLRDQAHEAYRRMADERAAEKRRQEESKRAEEAERLQEIRDREALDAALPDLVKKQVKGKKGTFTIRTFPSDGSKPKEFEVIGTVFGKDFAVSKAEIVGTAEKATGTKAGSTYNVTHLPTGGLVYHAPTLKSAKEAILRLRAGPVDWTKVTVKGTSIHPPEASTEGATVVKAMRAREEGLYVPIEGVKLAAVKRSSVDRHTPDKDGNLFIDDTSISPKMETRAVPVALNPNYTGPRYRNPGVKQVGPNPEDVQLTGGFTAGSDGSIGLSTPKRWLQEFAKANPDFHERPRFEYRDTDKSLGAVFVWKSGGATFKVRPEVLGFDASMLRNAFKSGTVKQLHVDLQALGIRPPKKGGMGKKRSGAQGFPEDANAWAIPGLVEVRVKGAKPGDTADGMMLPELSQAQLREYAKADPLDPDGPPVINDRYWLHLAPQEGRPVMPKKPLSGGKVIRSLMKAAVGMMPIRQGVGLRRALGLFFPGANVVRLKEANNIPVAVHELGHNLYRFLIQRGRKFHEFAFSEIPKRVRAQMLQLGKDLYGDTKPAGGYHNEGTAEFLRYWMTRRDHLENQAPDFLRWFENKVLRDNPDVAKRMHAARELVQEWSKQGAQARQRGRIRSPKEARARSWKAFAHWVKSQWAERGAALDVIDRFALEQAGKEGKTLFQGDLPGHVMQALRKGGTGMLNHWIYRGMTDMYGLRTGAGLDEIMKIARQGGEAQSFVEYLLAERGVERWNPKPKVLEDGTVVQRRPRNPGFSLREAEYVRDQLRNDHFEKAAELYYRWWDGVLNVAVEFGGMSWRDVAAIKGGSDKYLPLFRFMEEFEPAQIRQVQQPAMGKGKGHEGPIKKQHGSGREILDPIWTTVTHAGRILEHARQRAVVRTLTNLLTRHGLKDMGAFVELVPREQLPNRVSLERIRKQLEEAGVDLEEANLESVITFFTPQVHPKTGDPILSFVDGSGKVRWARVNRDVLDALDGMEVYRLDGWLDKTIGRMTRIRRLGTTGLRAGFALVTNPQRDFLTYMLQSQKTDTPRGFAEGAFNYLRGLYDQATGGAYADRFDAMGLSLSNMLGQDIALVRRGSTTLGRGAVGKFVGAPVRHSYETIARMLQFFESGARVGEFINASKDVGWKPGESMDWNQAIEIMLRSKRVTVDFTAAGRAGEVANQLIAFFNPAIQGVRSEARRIKEHPVATFVKGLALMTIPTALFYESNRDDEKYQQKSMAEKLLWWHIPAGEERVRWSLPQEWNVSFGMPYITAREYERTGDSRVLRDGMEVMARTVGIEADMLLPTGVDTALEQALNRDLFWDRPIVPGSMSHKLPAKQVGPYTSGTARIISKILPYGWLASPQRVDHMIQSIGGGVARDVTRFVDEATGYRRDTREWELSDLPVAGRAFERRVQTNSIDVQYLFEEWKELSDLARDDADNLSRDQRKRLDRLGDAAKAIRILSHARRVAPKTEEKERLQEWIWKIAQDARSGRTSLFQGKAELGRAKGLARRRGIPVPGSRRPVKKVGTGIGGKRPR